MVAQKETCALCGLEVNGAGVRQEFEGRELLFCCQGCARVYQLARETGALDQVLARTQGKASAPLEPAPAAATGTAEPTAAPAAMAGSPAQAERTARFTVQGMHCPSCPKIIVRTLRRQMGVLDAEVSLETGEGQVRYDPSRSDLIEILRAVDGLGMGYRTQLIAS